MLHRASTPHARAVHLVRLYRSVGGVRKTPGRVPRQQQPDGVRLEYFKAIRPFLDRARAEAHAVLPQIGHLLTSEAAPRGRQDSSGSSAARALLDHAARQAAAHFAPGELRAVARKFGHRTSDFQRAQIDRQVRSAIGVSFDAIERPTIDRIPDFVDRNVELIKTVPERYFDRLREDVEEAFAEGRSVDELAEDFADRYDMAEDDARRIARDQIGKLNGQVNQDRQEALGVTGYVWRTMRDQRVRDEHAEREGQSFSWDDPPEDGHPGEAVQCRCYSEPDFSEILGEE